MGQSEGPYTQGGADPQQTRTPVPSTAHIFGAAFLFVNAQPLTSLWADVLPVAPGWGLKCWLVLAHTGSLASDRVHGAGGEQSASLGSHLCPHPSILLPRPACGREVLHSSPVYATYLLTAKLLIVILGERKGLKLLSLKRKRKGPCCPPHGAPTYHIL